MQRRQAADLGRITQQVRSSLIPKNKHHNGMVAQASSTSKQGMGSSGGMRVGRQGNRQGKGQAAMSRLARV